MCSILMFYKKKPLTPEFSGSCIFSFQFSMVFLFFCPASMSIFSPLWIRKFKTGTFLGYFTDYFFVNIMGSTKTVVD